MDMAGNVWEWMDNVHEEDDHKLRALRGCSWFSGPLWLPCDARNRDDPVSRYINQGFRVICLQSRI